MSSLDRKLLRGLWQLRAQVLAIALVIASGAALLIMALTTIESLEETTSAYYERTRFADIFARAKRAPDSLGRDIAEIPGVRLAETRIVEGAILDMPGFAEPVVAQLISLPERGPQLLNALVIRSGRLVEPSRPNEVVVSEPFADAHRLRPGDSFDAVLRGSKRRLLVVGTALSPEFVYAIAPGGLMPDDERFGVMWMGRDALAAAFDLESSFNSVTLSLLPDADPKEVIQRIDALLGPFGGVGAYARADQTSNWFLESEIAQQKNMSRILPTIFLAVAAFLTNMVMARLIETERREIGLMKAFGYGNLAIGWHYAKMVLAIGTIGVLIGSVLGAWLGHWNTELYTQFYRFPFLLYRPGPAGFVIAGSVSLAAALAGSLAAVRRAVRLPPAEAMLPPSPPIYRRTWASRTALAGALDEPSRMILRRIVRWPMRAFLASLGLAMSISVLIMALQWVDAIDSLVETVFERGQHQDATVAFNDLQPLDTVGSFENLPGVLAAEPYRYVSAHISHGHHVQRQGIIGVPHGAILSPVFDNERGRIEVPPDGLVLSRKLAELLEVATGDTVTVEVLEGRQPQAELPVAQIFDTYIGKPAYMDMDALNRMAGDGRVVSGLHVSVDAPSRTALLTKLKDIPNIASILFRQAAIDTFYKTMGETIFIFIGFFVAFSMTLSVGVTYNSIRIALSERARELATLRVLGFSRWEISYILLGEVGILTWISIPIGAVLGFSLAWYMTSAFETELYRVPLVLRHATYGKAALIALAAALTCAAIVRRRLDRLDLIAVLKTRE
ncbi:putative ABC transport system permease protein [Sinorhizobium kostiense]|uniref:ABC transport system permease protein n=1 Tax=Sinorhizobium kostiense TaxID=76747 RepID=A0ABS4QSD3_9HYPH|nr:FtsX-like permease family protein [Sinorhizobium kostiense]MBP2233560.1 putative ABC transport system permease protein [Sinorhizobium kostiense]